MHSLLLGAGFSRWAAGLPIASDLFDFALQPFGPREEKRLEHVRVLKAQWDLLNPTGLAEQFIGTVLETGQERDREAILWYVVRRLSDPYIWQEGHAQRMRRHVLMIDENRKWERPGVGQAADFLHQCAGRLTGVITLNYDLLVEYALGTKGFNYGTFGEILQGRGAYPVSQWKKPVSLAGYIPLAKLHGSISWDTTGRYTDGRRGLTGKALIIAPNRGKSPPAPLRDVWHLASSILEGSSSLLVFGFGFNTYDQAVLDLLRNAGGSLKRVGIVDIVDREDAARDLWPGADIESLQPPPIGTGGIRNWLVSD